MKKILLSLGVIAVVGIVVAGATGAFYNDTETSTGNIFTAGSIDLKVDHTLQTYNGVDCKTCSVTVVSDTSNTVIEKNLVAVTPYSAVLAWVHSAWTAQNDPELVASGAQWIWEQNPTKQADTLVDTSYTFKKEFTWMGPIVSTDLYMAVGSDNGVQVYLNNVLIGSNTGEFGYLQGSMLHILAATITANVIQGNNVLKFVVTNIGLPNGTPQSNPAGLIYKFHINGKCGDAYFQNHCSLWQEKDLGAGDTFFNFGDVKPGDLGTDVISLHVFSNDAYACLIVNNKNDQENTIYGPETAAGDTTTPQGELSKYINVFTWGDANGDGVYNTGETALGSGSLLDLSSIMNMDAGNGQFLTATTTKNIGLAWCAGTLTPHAGSAFTCNGDTMLNDAQSDSFTADLTAYAEQVRNNSAFSCGSVQLPVRGEGLSALGPETISLGTVVGEGLTLDLGDLAIVAKTAITDASPAASSITGNVVIDPAAGSAITGVSCAKVTGTIYSSSGYTGGYTPDTTCAVTAPVLAHATVLAMEAAYIDAAGRTGPDGTDLYGGNLGGRIFTPGLYKWTTGVTIPTDVTLSGGANDIWIFQISGDLNIASTKEVKLIGGAQAKNVFWQVGGGAGAVLGTTSIFNGTILSAKDIVIQTGAKLNGRALSQTQVTLSGNIVTKP